MGDAASPYARHGPFVAVYGECKEFFRVHTKGGIQPCIRLPEGKGRAGRLHRRVNAETRVPGSRGRRVFERAEPFSRDGGQDQALRQGHLLPRDESVDGPSLDSSGVYRPRKPRDWDQYYQDTGPPKWTNYDYAKN